MLTFLCAALSIIADPTQAFIPRDMGELQNATIRWCRNRSRALELYGHISNWNTSCLTSMRYLFDNGFCELFNDDINGWDTSRVTDMTSLFFGAKAFNQPIGNWDTSAVTAMSGMFDGAKAFNQPIGNWNTWTVSFMERTFSNTEAFNQPLCNWNTWRVTEMYRMFNGAEAFDQPIGMWNTSAVTSMRWMFRQAITFNQPIGIWNTVAVASLEQTFHAARAFNQPIGEWNTLALTSMKTVFREAKAFNQPLSNWNTSAVTSMEWMFARAEAFNQPIGNWDTSVVTTMEAMFSYSDAFNQPIGNWNTLAVTTMHKMFMKATAFNQPIGNWNTSRVRTMESMFMKATAFSQDIFKWDTNRLDFSQFMLYGATAFDGDCQQCEHASWVNHTILRCIFLAIVFVTCPSFVLGLCCSMTSGVMKVFKLLRCCFSPELLEDVVPWSKVCPQEVDPLTRGYELHRQVGPERWCITRADLDLFEREVRMAWKAGGIPDNAAFPNPYHDDPTIGPSMYQVNEHYIKPITAQYGGMSYALLLNPHGLTCDCFATHAWSEGIFEFVDKLRRAWPRECKSMYICFLSNPQCLEISDWLNVPIEESPFAKALSNASHVVVVPNRTVSIYRRLWCCYEAFVAYTLNKTILLPPPKVFVRWLVRRFALCIAIIFCSFLLMNIFVHLLYTSDLLLMDCIRTGEMSFLMSQSTRFIFFFIVYPVKPSDCLLWYDEEGDMFIRETCYSFAFVVHLFLWACVLSSRPLAPSKARLCCEIVLQIETSAIVGALFFQSIYFMSSTRDLACAPVLASFKKKIESGPIFFIYMGCTLGVLMFVHLMKRRTEEAKSAEANLLNFEALAAADCTDASDRRRILQALAGQEAHVEHALAILKHQGLSTKELRRVSMSASRVGNKGYVDIGLVMFVFFLWPLYFVFATYRTREDGFGIRHRPFCQSFFAAVVSYSICWWAYLYGDADLASLIIRSAFAAFWCAVVCNLFFGLWGFSGGVAFATVYFALKCKCVQHSQLQKLSVFLAPTCLLCWSFFSWEVLISIVSEGHCICLEQEITGSFVCLAIWSCAARAATRWCPYDHMVSTATTAFLIWSFLNSCLVGFTTATVFMVRKCYWQVLLGKLRENWAMQFPEGVRYIWMSSCMVFLGVISPLCLLGNSLCSRWRQRTRSEPVFGLEMSGYSSAIDPRLPSSRVMASPLRPD